jgi:hypothetical protein
MAHHPQTRSLFLRNRILMPINAAAAALLAVTCTVATAQPIGAAPVDAHSASAPSQAPLSKGEIKAQREFKMLDFNGDGKLSRSEVKLFPRLAGAFDEADTSGDGFVSYEEVRAFAVKYRAERDRAKAAQAAGAPTPGASAPKQ